MEAFVQWLHDQESNRNIKKIQMIFNADTVAFALKPVHDIIPGIESTVLELRLQEMEGIPVVEYNHTTEDDGHRRYDAIERQWKLAHDIVRTDSDLMKSLDRLRRYGERTINDMRKVDTQIVKEFKEADHVGKNAILQRLWTEMSIRTSDRVFEQSWFTAQIQLLRILTMIHFSDKILHVVQLVEDAVRGFEDAFDFRRA